jgi:hypothetical protein
MTLHLPSVTHLTAVAIVISVSDDHSILQAYNPFLYIDICFCIFLYFQIMFPLEVIICIIIYSLIIIYVNYQYIGLICNSSLDASNRKVKGNCFYGTSSDEESEVGVIHKSKSSPLRSASISSFSIPKGVSKFIQNGCFSSDEKDAKDLLEGMHNLIYLFCI